MHKSCASFYQFEAEFRDRTPITFPDCKKYINDILEDINGKFPIPVSTVNITDGIKLGQSRTRVASYNRLTKEITIPRSKSSKWLALHELAHHITRESHPECISHGPEFCATFLNLLFTYKCPIEAIQSLHQMKRRKIFISSELLAPALLKLYCKIYS